MKIKQFIISLLLKNANKACDKVLLCDFIECTNNKQFKRIKRVKWLYTPKFILQMAWTILFEEYCRLSRNSGYELFYEGMKNVYKLDAKLLAISCAINSLKNKYDLEQINILKSFGYNYKFDQHNKNEFNKDLNKVISKCKSIAVERDREKARFEKLSAQNISSEQGLDYFNISLITLSKYMGFRLDPKRITVREFCDMTVGYEKEIEFLMNKK